MKKLGFLIIGLLTIPAAILVCGVLSGLIFLFLRFWVVLLIAFIIFVSIFLLSSFNSIRTKHKPFFYWWFSGVITGAVLIGCFCVSLLFIFSTNHPGSLPEYPDQKQIIEKIETYKRDHGHYPENLDLLGYGKYKIRYETADVGVNYWLRDGAFTLCYIYAELIGTNGECYDSRTGKWEAR